MIELFAGGALPLAAHMSLRKVQFQVSGPDIERDDRRNAIPSAWSVLQRDRPATEQGWFRSRPARPRLMRWPHWQWQTRRGTRR